MTLFKEDAVYGLPSKTTYRNKKRCLMKELDFKICFIHLGAKAAIIKRKKAEEKCLEHNSIEVTLQYSNIYTPSLQLVISFLALFT